MAGYRGKKKGGAKKGPKKGKKSRKANGRKLARYNELRAHGASKAEARAEVWGHRAKGGKRKGKKGGRKTHHPKSHRRSYAKTRSSDFMEVLNDIQVMNGTLGEPATAAERAQARETISMLLEHQQGPRAVSEAERLQAKFRREKDALVNKVAEQKLREAERDYKRDLKRKAKEEAERELRSSLSS